MTGVGMRSAAGRRISLKTSRGGEAAQSVVGAQPRSSAIPGFRDCVLRNSCGPIAKKAIYMVDNARINVAGLVGEKVDCVAEAILLTKDHVSK
jgi:hypothetical protein